MIYGVKMPKTRAELDALIARAEVHGAERTQHMAGFAIRNLTTVPRELHDAIDEELTRAVRILEGEADDYAETARREREAKARRS